MKPKKPSPPVRPMTPEEEAKYRLVRLQACYRAVFGLEGHRTQEQIVVAEDLAKFCYMSVPLASLYGQQPPGPLDINRVLNNEGRREVFLYIRTNSAPPVGATT